MEDLWPLIVPPLMTLLDDSEPRFRVRGVVALQTLLPQVHANFLKRTGVAELAQKVEMLQLLWRTVDVLLILTTIPLGAGLCDRVWTFHSPICRH